MMIRIENYLNQVLKMEDYCKEFKNMWEGLMSVAYEDDDSEEDKGDEDSVLVSRLSKS